jgi:hypothetical protein
MKYCIGTSKIGDDMLMNQLGSRGVILKNRRYQNKLSFWSFNLELNLIIIPGINLTISAFPRIHDTQYHIVAPEVAQIHTSVNPSMPPNNAPDSILKKIAPGMANVCKNTYRQQKAAITS